MFEGVLDGIEVGSREGAVDLEGVGVGAVVMLEDGGTVLGMVDDAAESIEGAEEDDALIIVVGYSEVGIIVGEGGS